MPLAWRQPPLLIHGDISPVEPLSTMTGWPYASSSVRRVAGMEPPGSPEKKSVRKPNSFGSTPSSRAVSAR